MSEERTQPILGRLADQISAPGRTVLIAGAVLLVLGIISTVFAEGTIVHVTTNAPGAQVVIDGQPGDQVDASTWRFVQVPWGVREARAAHRDYVPHASVVDVGMFGEDRFQIQLERRKIRLTVNTTPGAEILLDGQAQGKANESGVFFSDQVLSGEYVVAVRLTGYEPWGQSLEIRNNETSFRASLQMTQERREEVARQRDRAFELMQEASELFGRRNYPAALQAINESLRLYPDDYRAQQLRERIVETIKILQ